MTKQTLDQPQREATLPADIAAFCSLIARIVYRNIMERHAHTSPKKELITAEQPEHPCASETDVA
jgi:hypothetical protein